MANRKVNDDTDGEQNEKKKESPASPKSRRVLQKIRAVFTVSKEFLSEKIVKGMVDEAARGLAGEESTLQMLPTFVTGLPTGQEKGARRVGVATDICACHRPSDI